MAGRTVRVSDARKCPFCGSKPDVSVSPGENGIQISCRTNRCRINPISDGFETLRVALRWWNGDEIKKAAKK